MGPRTTDDDLRISRALAIEAYAEVESSLVTLMACLLGITNDLAAIVFFRITNTAARNKILDELLEHRLKDQYETYWWGQSGNGQKRITGLFALIEQLDQRRNEIVHWHPTSSSSSLGESWDDLRPAYHWARLQHLKPLTRQELDEFTAKAKFVAGSVFHFTQYINKPVDVFLRAYGDTWPQIFEQPTPYPPASTHPLAQKTQER